MPQSAASTAAKILANGKFWIAVVQVAVIGFCSYLFTSVDTLQDFAAATKNNRWTIQDQRAYEMGIEKRLDEISSTLQIRTGRGVPPPEVEQELRQIREELGHVRGLVEQHMQDSNNRRQ